MSHYLDRLQESVFRILDLRKAMVAVTRQSHTRTTKTGKIVPVKRTDYVMESTAVASDEYYRGEPVTIVASTEYMRPGEIIDNTIARLFEQKRPAIKKELEAEADAAGMSGDKKKDYVKMRIDARMADHKRTLYDQIETRLQGRRADIEKRVDSELKREGHTGPEYDAEMRHRIEQSLLRHRADEYGKLFGEKIQGTKIQGRVTQAFPDIDRVLVATEHGDFMVPTKFVAKKKSPGMSGDQHHGQPGENVFDAVKRDSEPYRKKHQLQRQKDADDEKRKTLIENLRHDNATEPQKLVYEHMDYANNMASHYYRKYAARMQGVFELDDLQQQATLGLIKAANAWHSGLGSEFPVYAHGYITAEIRDTIMRGLQICQMPPEQFRRWIRYQRKLEQESFLPKEKVEQINKLSRSYADRKHSDRQTDAWKRNYGEARNALIDDAFQEYTKKYPLLNTGGYIALSGPDEYKQEAADTEISTRMQHKMINQYMAAAISQSNDVVTKELENILTPHEHAAFKLFSYGWDDREIGHILTHIEKNRGAIPDAIDYQGSSHKPMKRMVENPANYYFQAEFKRLTAVYGSTSNPNSVRRLMNDDQRLVYDHLHDPTTGARRSVRQVVAELPEKRSVGKVHKDIAAIDKLLEISGSGGSGENIFRIGAGEDVVGRHFLDRARVKILEKMPLLEKISGYRFRRAEQWHPQKLMDV